MAQQTVNRSINIFIQTGEAQRALDILIKKETALKDALDKATDPAKIKRLEDGLLKLQEPLERARKKASGELAPSFKDVEATVNSLGNRLKRMSEDDADFSEVITQYRQGQKELDGQREKIGLLSGAMRSFKDELKTISAGVLIANGVQAGFNAIVSGVQNMIGASAKISDELSDIEKTTGLLPEDVLKVNAALEKIDTRTSAADLRELASEAGKLGKESVPDVLKFVEAADKIKVALGEDLGAEAITDIAKTSGIFKTEMLNMASAINEIGANSAASESFSVDFLKRLAGVAPTVKLSADQVLGYSAALEIAGQTSEVASSALNTFFIDFAKDTEKFGKAAGFAQGELTKLVQTKGTNEGFLQFLDKLKQANPDAASFLKKMEDLGIDGARGSNVMLALSNNIEQVRTQQEIANKAIQSNSSIMAEFTKKNTNAAAELDKLKNNFASLFTSNTVAEAGGALFRTLNGLINILKDLPGFIAENKLGFLALAAGIVFLNGSLIASGALWIKDSALKVANAVITRTTTIANNLLGASTVVLTNIIQLLTGRMAASAAATNIWRAALSLGAGPIGVILVAVGALAIAMAALINRTHELTNLQKIQAEVAQKVAESTHDQLTTLDTLVKVVTDSATAEDTRAKALQKIIDLNPQLLKGLTLENIATQQGTDIINNYVKALKDKATMQAKADIVQDAEKTKIQSFAEIRASVPAYKNLPDTELEKLVGSAAESQRRVGIGKFNIGSLDPEAIQKTAMALEAIKAFQKDVDQFNVQKVKDQLAGNGGLADSAGKAAGILEALKKKVEDLTKQRTAATDASLIPGLTKQIQDTEAEIARLEGRTTSAGKAAAKSVSDFQKLKQELENIADSLRFQDTGDEAESDRYRKQLLQLKEKYDEFTRRAKGNKQLLLLIEQDYNGELEKIQDAHYRKELERLEKMDKEQRKLELEKREFLARMATVQLPETAAKISTALVNDAGFRAELDVIKARGRDKLAAQLRQLDLEKSQELAGAQKTTAARQLIDEKYRLKKAQLEKDALLSTVNDYLDIAKSALDIFSMLSDAKAAKENAELQRDQASNERKKRNLDNALKSGMVSQLEYDRKVQDIEKKAEARDRETKLRQFQRAQKMQIAQALINGAMAVTSTLAAIPGPLDIASLGAARIIQIALAVATTATQIGVIAGQKPSFARGGQLQDPHDQYKVSNLAVDRFGRLRYAKGGQLEDIEDKRRYARGGYLQGPSHAAGGIQLYSRNGYHFGEAEGGEAIINKKSMKDPKVYTLSGTLSQIASQANAVHGGVKWESGGVLKPKWHEVPVKRMNTSAIYHSVEKVRNHYATGGIIGAVSKMVQSGQAPGEAAGSTTVVDLSPLQEPLADLATVITGLTQRLNAGIKASVALSDLNDQQDRLARIKREASMTS
jgi:TP901 family phage tail tape measure protein